MDICTPRTFAVLDFCCEIIVDSLAVRDRPLGWEPGDPRCSYCECQGSGEAIDSLELQLPYVSLWGFIMNGQLVPGLLGPLHDKGQLKHHCVSPAGGGSGIGLYWGPELVATETWVNLDVSRAWYTQPILLETN